MKSILVTGATGFVGGSLCRHLVSNGFKVRGTLLPSEEQMLLVPGVEAAKIEPIGSTTSWSPVLEGVDTIIHLAARVHVMDDSVHDPLAEFRKVNTDGTEQLACEAAKAGVKRFVFISTIKVNGEESPTPYTEGSLDAPTEPYGISKWEAEQALRRIEAETGLEVVIVRPTLVYGPGVKANFYNMMKAVSLGIPLPLASVHNKRSLVYIGNLVDALTTCATHPFAAGQTFLVSDGDDLSTSDLIRKTASALGVPVRLFPMPLSLIVLAAKVTGRTAVINRLAGSLMVSSDKIRCRLDWEPPFTLEEGLRETAEWFKGVN